MARCKKGSNRHRKQAGHIARLHGTAANIRRDFAHQTSYRLAESPIEVFVAEDLKVANMVKAPKPKMQVDAATGEIATAANGTIKYQRNGRRAKAGLARSILASCWGQTWTYLQYKARRRSKLTIKVPRIIRRRSVPNAATLTRITVPIRRRSGANAATTRPTPILTPRKCSSSAASGCFYPARSRRPPVRRRCGWRRNSIR